MTEATNEEQETEPTKRGRKPAEPETADTFMANIRTLKGIQIDPKTKVERGKEMRVPLSKARQWIKKKGAEWADPRPDL